LMSPHAVHLRKAVSSLMDSEYAHLNECYDGETWPADTMAKIKALGVVGMNIKGYGSPGLTTIEAAAIAFEMCKRDSAVGGFFIVHNCISMKTIADLGDEE